MEQKKILIADDSVTIQKVIRLALAQEGYTIEVITEGSKLLPFLIEWQPHIVLIDISLPEFTAFEIKKQVNLNPLLKDIPFILMSNAFETIDEQQKKQLNFQGHITKPFDPAQLRELLINAGKAGREKTKTTSRLMPQLAPTMPPPLDKKRPPSFNPPPDMPLPPKSPANHPPEFSFPSPPPLSTPEHFPQSAPPPFLADFNPPTPPPWDHHPLSEPPKDFPQEDFLEKDEEISKLTHTTMADTHMQWELKEPFSHDKDTHEFAPPQMPNAENTFLSDHNGPEELHEKQHEEQHENHEAKEFHFSEAKLTLIVQEELKKLVEHQVAAKIPEIVERVIKEEIQKLLQ